MLKTSGIKATFEITCLTSWLVSFCLDFKYDAAAVYMKYLQRCRTRAFSARLNTAVQWFSALTQYSCHRPVLVWEVPAICQCPPSLHLGLTAQISITYWIGTPLRPTLGGSRWVYIGLLFCHLPVWKWLHCYESMYKPVVQSLCDARSQPTVCQYLLCLWKGQLYLSVLRIGKLSLVLCLDR